MSVIIRQALALSLTGLALSACATAAPHRSGFLSDYEPLKARDGARRAAIREYRDAEALKAVKRVTIAPTVLTDGADARAPLTPEERYAVLREIDAQLCFELSERFEIVPPAEADAEARAAVTWFEPTGRLASAASAASSFLIPGPLGLRAPGTLGGLGVEVELRALPAKRQIAAMAWARRAMAVGTDNPSLLRTGDALQFAEPFADAAAALMTPEGLKSRSIDGKDDPCKAFGDRVQAGNFVAQKVIKLYIPDQRGEPAPQPEPAPTPTPPK